MAAKELTEDEEDALLEKLLNPSEKLRKKLLHEEFRLRKKQPTSWVKTKYRKTIIIRPKDEIKAVPLPPGYSSTVEAQLAEFAEKAKKRVELSEKRKQASIRRKTIPKTAKKPKKAGKPKKSGPKTWHSAKKARPKTRRFAKKGRQKTKPKRKKT